MKNEFQIIDYYFNVKGTLMQISKFCNTFEKTVSHRLRIITPFNL